MSETNNTHIHNAKDVDVVMPRYNLIIITQKHPECMPIPQCNDEQ